MEEETASLKHYELVFEGPVDDSLETMRKLRASLLADLGLTITEAQVALTTVPSTLKTAAVEDELKPLYSALKKAGGKVLIVKPVAEEIESDGGYFLDIESSSLNDELLQSLAELDAPEESHDDSSNDRAYSLDLEDSSTPQLSTTLQRHEEAAPKIAQTTGLSTETEATQIEKSTDANAVASAAAPKSPAPAVPAGSLFEVEAPGASIAAEPAAAKTQLPSVALPSLGIELEESTVAAAPAAPPVAKVSAPVIPAPAVSTPAPATNEETFDLNLEIAPEPEIETAAPSKLASSATEEDPFSKDALSQSLAKEAAPAPPSKKPLPEPPQQTLHLGIEKAETAAPAAQKTSVAKEEKRVPATQAAQPTPAATEHSYKAENIQASAEQLGYRELPRQKAAPAGASEILLPVLIGALVLGAANWMYFVSGDSSGASISFSIPDEETVQDSSDSALRNSPRATEKVATAEYENEAFLLKWTVHFDDTRPLALSIELHTPKVADLTPEEIVRKEAPRLWVKRIEAVRVPLEKQLGGLWGVKTQARIFLEKGELKRRVPAELNAKIQDSSPGKAGQLTLRLQRGHPSTGELPRFSTEELAGVDVRLAVSGTFAPK
jgi:hypothetical protein